MLIKYSALFVNFCTSYHFIQKRQNQQYVACVTILCLTYSIGARPITRRTVTLIIIQSKCTDNVIKSVTHDGFLSCIVASTVYYTEYYKKIIHARSHNRPYEMSCTYLYNGISILAGVLFNHQRNLFYTYTEINYVDKYNKTSCWTG